MVQWRTTKYVLQMLGALSKLASFTTDGGKDAMGEGAGVLGRIQRDLKRPSFPCILRFTCSKSCLGSSL